MSKLGNNGAKTTQGLAKLEEPMHERAAHWVARLRADDCSETDLQDFALWLSASPAHEQAMDSMLDLWDDLAVLEFMPHSESVEVADEPEDSPHQPARRQWLGLGLATAATLLLAIFIAPLGEQATGIDSFQTARGETSSLTLNDGSVLTLNTDTLIQVQMNKDRRYVMLRRGEVFFEVQKDASQRPFVVDAGHAQVQVLGTAFNIRLEGDRSDITVTEGVVRVSEIGNPGHRAAASELLYANQAIATDASGLATAATADSSVSTAWRDGRIIADAMPLGKLVQEIGRYHDRKILIAEPALAQTRVSGVFQLQDPDTILKALKHSVGIEAITLEDDSVLLIKATL